MATVLKITAIISTKTKKKKKKHYSHSGKREGEKEKEREGWRVREEGYVCVLHVCVSDSKRCRVVSLCVHAV